MRVPRGNALASEAGPISSGKPIGAGGCIRQRIPTEGGALPLEATAFS